MLVGANMTNHNCSVSGSQDREVGAALRASGFRSAPCGGAANEHPEVTVVPDASAGEVLVQLGARDAA